jgi:5-(carboxyamino)imidazole ribonucleotide mutase
MLAAKTLVPVLGVPVAATQLNGLDSLLSIVQMPKGVPVGTLAIGRAGAANAALLAAEILAGTDAALYDRIAAWRAVRTQEVLSQKLDQKLGEESPE